MWIMSPFKTNAAFKSLLQRSQGQLNLKCCVGMGGPLSCLLCKVRNSILQAHSPPESVRGPDTKILSVDQAVCLTNLCFDLGELVF